MTVVLTSMLSVMQRYFCHLLKLMIEKGGYPQAEILGYINEVRARVGMPAVEAREGTNLNKEELRAIVMSRTPCGIGFEDLRFADLYRWGREFENAQKRMQKDQSFYGFGVALSRGNLRGAQDLVWPIPQGEIDTRCWSNIVNGNKND